MTQEQIRQEPKRHWWPFTIREGLKEWLGEERYANLVLATEMIVSVAAAAYIVFVVLKR